MSLVETRNRGAQTIGGEDFVRAHTPVFGGLDDRDRLVLVRADVPPAASVSARTRATPDEPQTLAEHRQGLNLVLWITRSKQALD